MPNRMNLVVHYLACLRGGFVATPLNYRYAAPQIDHALEVSGASLLLAHVERRDDLKTARHTEKLPLSLSDECYPFAKMSGYGTGGAFVTASTICSPARISTVARLPPLVTA